MGPKRKPKDDVKKEKGSKSQNQVLLFQYFPNLNQNKTKVYENILNKPNAVFKEEKKLGKQVLSQQNQIIKQINNLFRQIFKDGNHEQINKLALLFSKNLIKQSQNPIDHCNFLKKQNLSKQITLNEFAFKSPMAKQNPQQSQGESQTSTRTISIRKSNKLDLTDFQFRQSNFKQRDKQKVRGQRKYSQKYVSPDNTITMWKQVQHKSKSQVLNSDTAMINWTEFEFDPFSKNRQLQAESKNISRFDPILKEQSPSLPYKQDSLDQTITIQNHNSLRKESPKPKKQYKIGQNPQPQTEQFNNKESESQLEKIFIVQLQPQVTPSKQTKIHKGQSQITIGLQFLDIDCDSSLKKGINQIEKVREQKLRQSINKIIQLMQKRQKAKQQEFKFRMFVKQAKQKQIKKGQTRQISKQQDILIDPVNLMQQVSSTEQMVCIARKNSTGQKSDFNANVDVLDCILHRQSNPEFVYMFQHQEGDQDCSDKQVCYKIKDDSFNDQHEDQVSTKQQSKTSSNSISSQKFIEYIENLQPQFDIPTEYLLGYTGNNFNSNLFKKIHDLEVQKAKYESKIQDTFI